MAGMKIENGDQKRGKRGFWQSLFSGSKCNRCWKSENSCVCQQKQAKTKNVQSQTEFQNLDQPMDRVNRFCAGNAIQAKAQLFPLARRGCGVHLFFWVDKQPISNSDKKTVVKNKAVALKKCISKVNIHSPHPEGNGCFNETNSKDGPKVTVLCNKVDTSGDIETIYSDLSNTESYLIRSTNHQIKEFADELEKTKLLQQGTPKDEDNGVFQDKTKDKYTDTDCRVICKTSLKNEDIDFLVSSCPKKEWSTTSRVGKNKLHQSENGTQNQNKPKLDWPLKSKTEKTPAEVGGMRKSILRNTQINDPLSQTDISVNYTPDYDHLRIRPSEDETSELWNQNQNPQMVYNMDSNFRPRPRQLSKASFLSKRKTFTKHGSIFGPNRQTIVNSMIGLILNKLGDIEKKLNNLEETIDDENKEVFMGISCDRNKSKVCIQFNPQEKAKTSSLFKNNEEESAQEPNKEVIVHKHKNYPLGGAANSWDTEDYTIDSDTKKPILKCKNPTIIIDTGRPNQCRPTSICQGEMCVETRETWRQVSEELKVDVNRKKSRDLEKCYIQRS